MDETQIRLSIRLGSILNFTYKKQSASKREQVAGLVAVLIYVLLALPK